MTKLEFMKELESLLLDIPLEERDEALKYYNGYFEDAGEDHEEEIIAELGSPKQVADIIKADLNSNAADRESRGYFTENGYQDNLNKSDRQEIIGTAGKQTNGSYTNSTGTNSAGANSGNTNNYYQNKSYNQQTNANQNAGYNQNSGQSTGSGYQNQTNTHSRNTNTGLIIIIGILAFPVWFPLLCSAFGIVVAIFGTIFGIIVGFGAAGIAMIFAGIAIFISGLIQMSAPLIGLAFCGAGLLVFGIGMLFALACGAFCTKVLPAFIKGVVNLCRLPFKNRSVMA